jgi:hypothetical protein
MLMRFLAFLIAASPLCLFAGVFDSAEPQIAPSPAAAIQVSLPEGLRVVDFDVSPIAPLVAVVVASSQSAQQIRLWNISNRQPELAFALPAGFNARAIAWHPLGNAIFVTGNQGQEFSILRLDKKNAAWTSRRIYSSRREIRRLVAGPRPYQNGPVPSHRLFFGLRAPDGTYSVHSITEEGRIDYQVVGHRENFTHFPNEDRNPSELASPSALPLGFHPAGHLLLWEDARHCVQVARYDRDYWSKSAKLFNRDFCDGAYTFTPNGAGLIHWTPQTSGVELMLDGGRTRRKEAEAYTLTSTPSSTADGKGIVGTVRTAAGLAFAYIPVKVPLADSVNAWMYLESDQDTRLFSSNGGLFRDLNKNDQLYQLYDSEAYQCGNDLDESTPTRPYLVTSDAFWELFAAAYEGIFIVRERQTAIPAFWQFIDAARTSLTRSAPQSPWTRVFTALAALRTNQRSNDEAQRILTADRPQRSSVLNEPFDYAELKPRGHYAATPESQIYFRGFRYLTRVSATETATKWGTAELRQLPPEVKSAAMRWIDSYRDLIAPSRAPLLWQDSSNVPGYVRHPATAPALFPLSWGFDNESLYATTYHANLPDAERIEGPAGKRLQPDAFDIAAALGSQFARSLLAGELHRYPNLDTALKGLSARSAPALTESTPNLYQRWIDAIAQQWADSVPSPNGALDQNLWRAKRLQSGLASWATLRHATVLVNEREGAECGEGGFEFIVMRPPRGYVEPDPQTFGKMARLFDGAMALVNTPAWSLSGTMPRPDNESSAAKESVKQGLLRRLKETADKARLFQSIALKETQGRPLTSTDYEEILYFGRVAEHHFLVYKSLANKDLALSTPNPIPKIADVADLEGHEPYLMAGVGRPLEWDHVVPFFGRHEIVKGAAYSFYEFSSPSLLNDADWLKRLPSQPHPAWIAPFVSSKELSCPPNDPF